MRLLLKGEEDVNRPGAPSARPLTGGSGFETKGAQLRIRPIRLHSQVARGLYRRIRAPLVTDCALRTMLVMPQRGGWPRLLRRVRRRAGCSRLLRASPARLAQPKISLACSRQRANRRPSSSEDGHLVRGRCFCLLSLPMLLLADGDREPPTPGPASASAPLLQEGSAPSCSQAVAPSLWQRYQGHLARRPAIADYDQPASARPGSSKGWLLYLSYEQGADRGRKKRGGLLSPRSALFLSPRLAAVSETEASPLVKPRGDLFPALANNFLYLAANPALLLLSPGAQGWMDDSGAARGSPVDHPPA
jgi:hypothetical protein